MKGIWIFASAMDHTKNPPSSCKSIAPAEEMTTTLSYDTLPIGTSFRLLNLSPGRNGPQEAVTSAESTAITVSMATYDLADAPPFRALSYTQGIPYRGNYEDDAEIPSDLNTTIICSGKSIAVTQNL